MGAFQGVHGGEEKNHNSSLGGCYIPRHLPRSTGANEVRVVRVVRVVWEIRSGRIGLVGWHVVLEIS